MNILLCAAECTPFAKVGGLADMVGALPKAWRAQGHNVCVVLPMYGTIDAGRYQLVRTDIVLVVPMGTWNEYAEVWQGTLPGSDVPVYLIRSSDYYDRPGIYGYHDGFQDNDRRFIFLSIAAFELAKALQFRPHVIHSHDYHTAPCMPLLKIRYAHDPFFAETSGVFTIHNMAYQGMYESRRAMELCRFNQSDFYPGSWFEHDGVFNCLKTGIMFADKITTVSPTYAQEIRWTPEGMGLQSALQTRGGDIIGVLNGIDTEEWNPETDAYSVVQYDAQSIEKKQVNKLTLLRHFNVTPETPDKDLPLLGMVSRLTEQKGISLLVQCLERFVAHRRMRFVLLGSGEQRFEQFFRDLAARHPDYVFMGTGYNNALSHQIQSSSDFYLMPSQFEPCGLTQLFALKYGTIPIVRNVGGLSDTVQPYDAINLTGNGIRFSPYTADACAMAIEHALELYRKQPHWDVIRQNAMSAEHSIVETASRYLDVFRWAGDRRSGS